MRARAQDSQLRLGLRNGEVEADHPRENVTGREDAA